MSNYKQEYHFYKMEEEYFDVVNEDNQVVSRAARSQCHHNPDLIHRDVHILVFNSKRELFLKKRGRNKDLYPLMWESSACGHLDCGETYAAAAARELNEELGIKNVSLKRISWYKNFTIVERQITELFICRCDGLVKLNTDEATEGRFFPLSEVISDIESGRREFAPAAKLALAVYLKEHRE